jgi:hypothetical protein
MRQVINRGVPLIEDPDRLAHVSAVGVDETAYLRANATRATLFATGIADLSPGRVARLLDVVEGRSGTVLAADVLLQGAANIIARRKVWHRPSPIRQPHFVIIATGPPATVTLND